MSRGEVCPSELAVVSCCSPSETSIKAFQSVSLNPIWRYWAAQWQLTCVWHVAWGRNKCHCCKLLGCLGCLMTAKLSLCCEPSSNQQWSLHLFPLFLSPPPSSSSMFLPRTSPFSTNCSFPGYTYWFLSFSLL